VTSRLAVPPDGIFGGEAGAAGRFVVNGTPITTQARVTLQPGDVVRLDLPGGGGYGERSEQDQQGERSDVAETVAG
jgi:N-methylhydantoinase B